MTTETSFVAYWRAANLDLAQRRQPGLNAGLAWLYWISGLSAAQAAEAEVFKGRL